MDQHAPSNPLPGAATSHAARVRVFASGSSGNCTLLCAGRSAVLIDAGLSPRRTGRLLDGCGLSIADLDAIVLTHLDRDHFHPGWSRALPAETPIFVHAAHEREAESRGVGVGRRRRFVSSLRPGADLEATAVLSEHDRTGSAAFRFSLPSGASLGFATDLGRPTRELSAHLAGVDVLAVESNYCPRLQLASERPAFLKQRVMGGAGHLSNEETASLIREIRPRDHVVFLHLSRQCNDPGLVRELHSGAGYRFTITSQFEATDWIPVRPGRAAPPVVETEPLRFARTLFDGVHARGLGA